jgi:hypothetical protein
MLLETTSLFPKQTKWEDSFMYDGWVGDKGRATNKDVDEYFMMCGVLVG